MKRDLADTPEYRSFREFYPFYLSQHADLTCRRLHFAGSLLVLALLIVAIVTANALWLIALPIAGYGFAWIGHFIFEKNKPATFNQPVYSLMGDWLMFIQILCAKVKI